MLKEQTKKESAEILDSELLLTTSKIKSIASMQTLKDSDRSYQEMKVYLKNIKLLDIDFAEESLTFLL